MYITNCDNFLEPNVFIACAHRLQLIIALMVYALVHSKFFVNDVEISKTKVEPKQKGILLSIWNLPFKFSNFYVLKFLVVLFFFFLIQLWDPR